MRLAWCQIASMRWFSKAYSDFIWLPWQVRWRNASLSLEITGKMERDGKKFGIGFSGIVTVLTLKALSAFMSWTVSWSSFKLASYTLLKLGDNGSMGILLVLHTMIWLLYLIWPPASSKMDWKGINSRSTYKDWVIKLKLSHQLAMWVFGRMDDAAFISKDMINLVKSPFHKNF